MFKSFLYVFVIYTIVSIKFPPPAAYAYLDPNTGSMILQMIAAGAIGLGCTFKIWGARLISVFRKKK